MNYLQDFNHPVDHTIVGSTEEFRSGEFQIEQVSFGGNFHWNNVQARFLSMIGLFAVTTPRNDASSGVGAVGPAGRLQVFLRGQRRLSLGREPRPERRRRHLRLLHRPVQLLQLRQLDLPALVRVVQHAVVLQRAARAVVPDPDAEDRALAHQRLAVLRQVQQPPGLRRPDPVDPERLRSSWCSTATASAQDNLASGSGFPNNGGNPNAAIGLPNPTRTVRQLRQRDARARGRQHRVEVLRRQGRRRHGRRHIEDGDVAAPGTSAASTAAACSCSHGPNKESFFGVDALRPHLVRPRPATRSRSAAAS